MTRRESGAATGVRGGAVEVLDGVSDTVEAVPVSSMVPGVVCASADGVIESADAEPVVDAPAVSARAGVATARKATAATAAARTALIDDIPRVFSARIAHRRPSDLGGRRPGRGALIRRSAPRRPARASLPSALLTRRS